MPSLFAHMTEKELDEHPAVEAMAAFLTRAILKGRVKLPASTEASATPHPQLKKAQRRTSTLQRKGA